MYVDKHGQSNRISRWFSVLALIFFILFAVVGFVVATNYQNIGNLIKVVALVKTQYIEPVKATSVVDGAAQGIVDALEDPYSVYLDAGTFQRIQELISGSFGGLGILVGVNKEGNLTVARVYEGTPASKEGVQAGDLILEIDDQDVRGIELEMAIGLMRGPVDTAIKLGIKREGQGELIPVNVIRKEISVPTVEGKLIPEDNRIGYIEISAFNENTNEEFTKVLADLTEQGIEAIILDLRDNGGGELISATQVADKLIPKGPIVYIDYRSGEDEVKEADDDYLNLPLTVLINEYSASAAEILAGAIKDTGVGVLVGTRTFGKGIVQTVFPLSDGAGLKLTTARYLTPNKIDIHKKGIEPDEVVESRIDLPEDEQLDKAIELVRSKL